MVGFVFILFSEFMKRFVGKLRPNFLHMCQPVYDINQGIPIGMYLLCVIINQKVVVNIGKPIPSIVIDIRVVIVSGLPKPDVILIRVKVTNEHTLLYVPP